jgi:hypothetical protein
VTVAPRADAMYAGYGAEYTVVRLLPPGITLRARSNSAAEREPGSR